MSIRVPIEDLQDTVIFDELVATSSTPIIVTKNGHDRFVCIRNGDFERMKRAGAEAQLCARMQIMEYEREHNLACDAFEVTEELIKSTVCQISMQDIARTETDNILSYLKSKNVCKPQLMKSKLWS